MSNTDYKFEDDIAYIEGKRKGLVEGMMVGKTAGKKAGKAEGKTEGEIAGRQKGKTKGKFEKNAVCIRNMTVKNFAPELIADVLELTVKSVEHIQRQLKLTDEIHELLGKGYTNKEIAKRLNVHQFLVTLSVKEDEQNNNFRNTITV